MKSIEGAVCLMARTYLGVSYIGIASFEIMGAETLVTPQFSRLQPSLAVELFNGAGLVLLAVVASWLILGICTRITALLGLMVMLAMAWSNQYLPISSIWAIYSASAVTMTVPLLLRGGGPYALVRRGWQGFV